MHIKNPFAPPPFLSLTQSEEIKKSIQKAEKKTSGEIRICIESKCYLINPLWRAQELFFQLKMNETKKHSAVLIYIAYKHKEFALFGDIGFHEKIGQAFWDQQAQNLKNAFSNNYIMGGIKQCIEELANELAQFFPYNPDDKNELPDEIVFGR